MENIIIRFVLSTLNSLWPLWLILFPGIVNGCAVCWGDPSSLMTQGANVAIMALMGITGTVLGGMVAFALRMRKRSRLLERHRRNGQAFGVKEEVG